MGEETKERGLMPLMGFVNPAPKYTPRDRVEQLEELRRQLFLANRNRTDSYERSEDSQTSNNDNRQKQEKTIASQIQLIRGIIGRGEHSIVYSAEMRGSKRLIVVKQDTRDFSKDYPALADKIDNLFKIEHPYIAKFYDYIPDKENHCTFFIMEYIPGESVQRRLNRQGIDKQGQVLDWTCQILEALAYLHKQGIIHGNIRTDNVIITPIWVDGEKTWQVRLIDFKMGSVWVEESAQHTLVGKIDPATGKTVSDEEFEEKKRWDVYYTAAVLYRMLTSEFPPKSMKREEKEQILRNHGVTKPVIQLVCKALDLDTDAQTGKHYINSQKSFPSAEAMLSAIRSLPSNDLRTRKVTKWAVAAVAAFIIPFFLGIYLIYLGSVFDNRTLEMEQQAQLASTAFEQANFSQALTNALDATEKKTRVAPAPAPVAQRVLAEATGVYDFIAGYKPLHSNPILRGVPKGMCLSPDGETLVVMTENESRGCSIQIFETETGNVGPVLAVSGGVTDFVIRNDGILLYSGSEGLGGVNLSNGVAWSPEDGTKLKPKRIDLSADGGTALVQYHGENAVHLYSDNGLVKTVKLPDAFSGNMSGAHSIDRSMLAMDGSGKHLAVSFDNGSVIVMPVANPEQYALVNGPSLHNHFEGGFYDGSDASYFLLVASAVKMPDMSEDISVSSISHYYNLQDLDVGSTVNSDGTVIPVTSVRQKDNNLIMYGLTDSSGMYLARNDEIYHILPEQGSDGYGIWGPELITNGDVRFFRHDSDSNRLMAVTKNRIVLLYEENGEVITDSYESDLVNGVVFQDGCLSPKYLALSGQGRVSVWKWEDWTSSIRASYPVGGSVISVRVLEKEHGQPTSVMVCREAGVQIYDTDGNMVMEQLFGDGLLAPFFQYQRAQNRLKVLYPNGTVEYYDPETGVLSVPEEEVVQEFALTFKTGHYQVEYRRNVGMSITYRGKRIATYNEQPVCASVFKDQLLVSVLNADGEHRSLLLDRQGQELAVLSGDCEVLPDGILYAATRDGKVLYAQIQSVEELRKLALDRRGGMG